MNAILNLISKLLPEIPRNMLRQAFYKGIITSAMIGAVIAVLLFIANLEALTPLAILAIPVWQVFDIAQARIRMNRDKKKYWASKDAF